MFFITVGSQHLYTGDTWNDNPFEPWIVNPMGTWIERSNLRDSLYLTESLEIALAVFGRSTATVAIWDENAEWEYQQGQIVEIFDHTYTKLFSGVIETIEKERILGPVRHYVHKLSCVDWTWAAEKRLVTLGVDGMLAGDIVLLLWNTILKDEGITIGEVQDGAVIPEFRAGFAQISEALKSLAEYSDFIWFINENRQLYFIAPTTYVAPRALEDEDIIESSYDYEIGNPEYVNRQYISGAKCNTDLKIREFAGDGKTRVFKLDWPVAVAPTMTLNGTPVTLGTDQVDTGKDFYWNLDNDSITQDSEGTILTVADTLHVEYIGLYNSINSATDYEEVAKRASLDGTSGIVEAIADGSLLTTATAAIAAATAKLTRYARDAEKFTFDTPNGSEFACGQMLDIHFSAFDFTKPFLITNIVITEPTEDNDVDTCVNYSITCIDGPASTDYDSVILAMNIATKTGKVELGTVTSDALLVYRGFIKTWLEADYPNPFNCGVVADDELPGDPYVPGFDPDDRWKYLVVYQGGHEIFRKALLSVEHATDRDYASCFVSSLEAVGNISHLGLWGGEQCSDVPGSGIELDKQVYVRSKTLTESLQVVFTEIRGWS
jgi:hypothetical protein